MKATAQEPTRKPYHRPEIQVHGDIRALTQAVGATRQKDGGKVPRNRSQV